MKIKARYSSVLLISIASLAFLVWVWALFVRLGVSLDLKYDVSDEGILSLRDQDWSEVQFFSGWLWVGCLAGLAVLLGYRWFIRPSET